MITEQAQSTLEANAIGIKISNISHEMHVFKCDEKQELLSNESRLMATGLELPPAPTPFGAYVPAVQSGNLLFLSGMLPSVGHKPSFVGRLGKELTSEQGRNAAYAAALNVIAVARQYLGSLNKVSRVVRLGVYIATLEDSIDQPWVADGASEVLRNVFGEDAMSVRSVFGVAGLPLGYQSRWKLPWKCWCNAHLWQSDPRTLPTQVDFIVSADVDSNKCIKLTNLLRKSSHSR